MFRIKPRRVLICLRFAIYPLIKRVSYWPQAWLAIGIGVGFAQSWYQIDEDGEVHLNSFPEPVEALPTPAATPTPLIHSDISDSNIDPHGTSFPSMASKQDLVKAKPREPTPTILSMLDNVSVRVCLDMRF